uniref:Uncharacterized protein n=1 Tax=Siphoviridae sp. ctHxr66 TaxID=2826237 RepID=A0A8S5MHC9_9CAUD|nr:MAG TPA: hypothetical protein [Siphoviridae sp. ctHxr66]DAH31820.1 MAG TPA: hypothetical protein [Caudoviricetes sp.]
MPPHISGSGRSHLLGGNRWQALCGQTDVNIYLMRGQTDVNIYLMRWQTAARDASQIVCLL